MNLALDIEGGPNKHFVVLETINDLFRVHNKHSMDKDLLEFKETLDTNPSMTPFLSVITQVCK